MKAKRTAKRIAKRVAKPKQKSAAAGSPPGLSSEEKLAVEKCVERARKEGSDLEEAILQRLREGLWRAVSEDSSPDAAKAWFATLIAARRFALLQRRSDAEERAKKETDGDKMKRFERFFGVKQYKTQESK